MSKSIQRVKDILLHEHPNGFTLEPMAIRLLKPLCGNDWDDFTEGELELNTFCRKDQVRFFVDQITDTENQQRIVNTATGYLKEYGCFSLEKLRRDFKENLQNLSNDIENFEAFLQFIMPSEQLKITKLNGVRVVRLKEKNMQECLEYLASEIKMFITGWCDKYNDSVSEDNLLEYLPAIDADMLTAIIKQYLPNILQNKSGHWISYQQKDTCSVPADFPEHLMKIVEQLESIGIDVTEEALHTAISLCYQFNFMQTYQLITAKEFRNLIKQYYQGKPRDWKGGKFCEKLS